MDEDADDASTVKPVRGVHMLESSLVQAQDIKMLRFAHPKVFRYASSPLFTRSIFV